MRKLIATIVCLGMMVLGTVGIATAVPITFTDTTYFNENGTDPGSDLDDFGWGDVDYLEGFGDYVTWTQYFDFDPAVEEVLNGELTLYLRDDKFDTWSPFTWEFAFHFAEDGSWHMGEVDTGMYSYVIDGSYLTDGEFSITLASIGGDFYIDRSDLEITYEPIVTPPSPGPNPAPVPEPATVMLVGTGLLGMIAFGRKRFNKKA